MEEFIVSDKIEIESLTKKRAEHHAYKPATEKSKGGRVIEEAIKAKVIFELIAIPLNCFVGQNR